jgi:hypothetical protein
VKAVELLRTAAAPAKQSLVKNRNPCQIILIGGHWQKAVRPRTDMLADGGAGASEFFVTRTENPAQLLEKVHSAEEI